MLSYLNFEEDLLSNPTLPNVEWVNKPPLSPTYIWYYCHGWQCMFFSVCLSLCVSLFCVCVSVSVCLCLWLSESIFVTLKLMCKSRLLIGRLIIDWLTVWLIDMHCCEMIISGCSLSPGDPEVVPWSQESWREPDWCEQHVTSPRWGGDSDHASLSPSIHQLLP